MPKKLTDEEKKRQKEKKLAYAKKYYAENRDKLIKYARNKCKYSKKRVFLEDDDPTESKMFKKFVSNNTPDFSRSEIQKAMIELPPKKPRKAPLPPKPVKKQVATSSKEDAAKPSKKPKPKKKLKIVEPVEEKNDGGKSLLKNLPKDIMDEGLGKFLSTSEKAKMKQTSKQINVSYNKKEFNEGMIKDINTYMDDEEEYAGQFVNTLGMINDMAGDLQPVTNKIDRYYAKYNKEIKKYDNRIIKLIKSKGFNKNVEDYLIDYFVKDNIQNSFEDYLSAVRNNDQYEDYAGDFWQQNDEGGFDIYRNATKEVGNDMKRIPNYAKKRYELIIKWIDLYYNSFGKNKLVKLPEFDY